MHFDFNRVEVRSCDCANMTGKLSEDPEIPIIKHKKSSILKLAQTLFVAVQRNNIQLITQLVSDNKALLKHEYPQYNHQNILILACNDQYLMGDVAKNTIETLVNLGAKCNEPSRNDYWEAIHYTALNANKEKMEAVIQYLRLEQVNSLVYCSKQIPDKYSFCPNKKQRETYCNNALNILLKYGNRDRQLHECCELLIASGINVNQEDSSGVCPSDLIWRMRDNRLNDILQLSAEMASPVSNSFRLIRLNSVKKFISLNITQEEINGVDGSDETTSSCTLLQLCCAKGLTSCVEVLLEWGANPNKVISKNSNSPVMIAIAENHEKIVKMLLKRSNLELPQDILVKLQIMYKTVKHLTTVDKYMKMVLKHLRRCSKDVVQDYLSFKDELKCTALHYAIRFRCPDNAFALLSMGASLIEKDRFGNTPLDSIEPHLLEKFFDSCIDASQDDKIVSVTENGFDQEFAVEINYESLTSRRGRDVRESQFLIHMVKQSCLNRLLNHPVVSSYLQLKWDKLKWPVYINLFLYTVAYLSLLIYGFAFNETSYIFMFLLVGFVLLVLRESIQILVFRLDYVKRVDNLINLLLIGGLTYIIAAGWLKSLHGKNLLVAYSVVFLTSTLGIFLQLSNISFFTIKVIIFKQITINFFQYMLFYMFPVLAFFFCFYMLSEHKENIFFNRLYEIVTMFSGNFEGDYPDEFNQNPIFSHLIFILFVILISIILHNLLIGLAVSDLQDIQKQAEFIEMKHRSTYITNVENIIFYQYHKSSKLRPLFRRLLNFFAVFDERHFLTIRSQSPDCVYLERNLGHSKRVCDQNFITHLQNILKNLSLKDNEIEDPYSLKSLHDKIQKLKNSIDESFNVPKKETPKRSS